MDIDVYSPVSLCSPSVSSTSPPSKPLTRSSSCPAFSPSSTLPSLCLPTSLSHSSPNITFSWSPPAPQPPALDTPLPPSTSESRASLLQSHSPQTSSHSGNTCYMNATLQALLGLSSFTSDLLRHRHCWESPSSALLLRNMGDLQVVRQNTTQTYKKRPMLKNIRRSISTICPEFSGDHQQDAHEFLLFCLIKLKEECASISHLELTPRCPVANMEFQLLSIYTCKRVLVLHLKRFGDISGTTKSSNPINIPLQLDLSRYNRGVSMGQLIPSNSTSCEELQDSVEQPDISLQAAPGLPTPLLPGHYICDVLEEDGSNWLCFNDDMVSREKTNILEERSSTAYLLFYVQSPLVMASAASITGRPTASAPCTSTGLPPAPDSAASTTGLPPALPASTTGLPYLPQQPGCHLPYLPQQPDCLTCLNNRAATCLTCLNNLGSFILLLPHTADEDPHIRESCGGRQDRHRMAAAVVRS
ncbi:hypothetical protein ACEWY4_001663 [Coilia grayii]|uniref:USP domain-containing protein n=1 Tax=Coilia grayii TaxID=363190 RepID=A0ABD1KTN8_9TELE